MKTTTKTQKMELSKLKLNQQVEINYQQAKELVKYTVEQYDFDNLNESTVTDTLEFETVQNRHYYVTKTGRKGSKMCKGNPFEGCSDIGLFEVEMSWDFRHPTNFCLNRNNCTRTFSIKL